MTNQALKNFRQLKSYQAFFFFYHNAMRLEIITGKKKKNCKKYKHMKAKQCTAE